MTVLSNISTAQSDCPSRFTQRLIFPKSISAVLTAKRKRGWCSQSATTMQNCISAELITPVEVNVGDVYLINAGLIHAIGAGCTILEVQEPTDFTIQIENWCGESRVTEQEKYLGLERDTAISIFDFDKFGEQAVKAAKITPETLYCDDNIKIESLIDYNDTPCFAEKRYTLKGGSTVMGFGPCVWTIVQGEGCVCGENYHRNVRKGDYFFMPYAAQGKFSLAGNLVAVECLPGRQD